MPPGLYRIITYAVAQRTQEIGIRMALGAQKRQVLRLALIGAIAGLAAGFALARLLSHQLFQVSTVDPLALGATAALLAVSLLACWIPARRAAKVYPLAALRHE